MPLAASRRLSLVKFNDDNPYAFVVCAYTLYDLKKGIKSAALLMAKAKLGPLAHKGETVKNELCGAILVSGLKIWLLQEPSFTFKKHHHFVDSMIVKEMLKASSY